MMIKHAIAVPTFIPMVLAYKACIKGIMVMFSEETKRISKTKHP